MPKVFYVQNNIGRARYVVSFHDGITTNRDQSPFFDIRIFHNKKQLGNFVKSLISEGYKETP